MDKTKGVGVFPSFTKRGIHSGVVGIDHEDWIVQETLSSFISSLRISKVNKSIESYNQDEPRGSRVFYLSATLQSLNGFDHLISIIAPPFKTLTVTTPENTNLTAMSLQKSPSLSPRPTRTRVL